MSATRRRIRRTAQPPFQPVSLINVFLGLIGRRRARKATPPNPDWERDEPMSGLS